MQVSDLCNLSLNPTDLPDEGLLDYADQVTIDDGEPLPVDVHLELAARGYDAAAYVPGDVMSEPERGPCQRCGASDGTRHRQRTQYVEEERNWVTLCPPCTA